MYSKITISGKVCTGKSTLFSSLTETLKWPTFSASQLFRQFVKEHHLTLEKADEQQEDLTKQIDSQIRQQLERHEKIIVEAWMAGIMAEGLVDVLTVFLTANDTVRFARFAEREKVSLEIAKQKVLEREASWFSKLAKIYNRRDFYDPKFYNLIIDTSDLTKEEILQQVLSRVKR